MAYFSSKKVCRMLIINYLYGRKRTLAFSLLVGTFINLFFYFSVFSQSETFKTFESIKPVEDKTVYLDSASLQKRTKTSFDLGFRGGITFGRFDITNPERNDNNATNLGSALTLFATYKINSDFSIQPELALGRYRSNNTLYRVALLEGTIDYTISSFDFNVVGAYSYPVTDWFSLTAETGLSASILYNSFGKVVIPNASIGTNYYVDSDEQFKNLNYGILVGTTPSFRFKSVTLQTSIRYRYGLNNINSFFYTLNRYLANSERTIKTKDIILQIGFLIPVYKKVVISN